MLPIDALGFRRGAGALKTLLQDHGLADHPLFAQAKARGIRALAGHAESTDVTNDVNGGPSGHWHRHGRRQGGVLGRGGRGASAAPKIIAFEGEFAMTEGHAQELKTQALALKVGKRLRVMISDNNAGIDDSLIGGVIDREVRRLPAGRSVDVVRLERLRRRRRQRLRPGRAALKTMEDWDPADRRPMALIGKTIKGYWPAAVDGKIPDDGDQVVGYPSHPYAMKMNSEYFVALASTFEKRYGVAVPGHPRRAPVKDTARAADPVQDQHRRGDVGARSRTGSATGLPIASSRSATRSRTICRCASQVNQDPFLDERLRVANLPVEPQKVDGHEPRLGRQEGGRRSRCSASRARSPARGAAISEIVKWMNYVTGNRILTIAADLSESINLEHGSLWGHYDPETNPLGTRLKAAIQEAGNASTAIGLVSQSASRRSRASSPACGRSAAPTARSRR